MSNILITGASGFIGGHLTKQLASQGHQVSGIGHGRCSEIEMRSSGLVCWREGNVQLSNLIELQRTIGTPEIIFHLAGGASVGSALQNPHEDFSRTVESTSDLLEWVRVYAPEAIILTVSSAAVYGDGHRAQISEGEIVHPYSPYGYHKAIMELLCRSYCTSYGLRCIVARLFSVYGEGLRKQLLWDICNKLSRGCESIELGGDGHELRDWVHVRDVVNALSGLATSASSQMPIVNVGTGIGTDVNTIANQVATSWSAMTGETKCEVSFNGNKRLGDPQNLIADTLLLQSLGYACHSSLEMGIKDYVAWFLAQQNEKSRCV